MAKNSAITWPDLLTSLVAGQNMDEETTSWAMTEILSGNVSPTVMAAFMVALRSKGETVEEVSGLANAMLDKATPINIEGNFVDIVGSGGDRANTVNISTMAAIVAAAAGARVVKHGNRSASSMSGAADCLEALGMSLMVSPQDQARVMDECQIVFLFAPLYHTSLKYTAPTRRELGIQTTFNFLGPLTNPAHPLGETIGIANAYMAPIAAGVYAKRGCQGMVFRGNDGLDELTTTSESDIWLFKDGQVKQTTLDPAKLGIKPAQPQDLVGGSPAHNAQVVREILNGKTGAVRDIVLLNAAGTILSYDGPSLEDDLEDQFAKAYARAGAAIDDGKAGDLLERWIRINAELGAK